MAPRFSFLPRQSPPPAAAPPHGHPVTPQPARLPAATGVRGGKDQAFHPHEHHHVDRQTPPWRLFGPPVPVHSRAEFLSWLASVPTDRSAPAHAQVSSESLLDLLPILGSTRGRHADSHDEMGASRWPAR